MVCSRGAAGQLRGAGGRVAVLSSSERWEWWFRPGELFGRRSAATALRRRGIGGGFVVRGQRQGGQKCCRRPGLETKKMKRLHQCHEDGGEEPGTEWPGGSGDPREQGGSKENPVSRDVYAGLSLFAHSRFAASARPRDATRTIIESQAGDSGKSRRVQWVGGLISRVVDDPCGLLRLRRPAILLPRISRRACDKEDENPSVHLTIRSSFPSIHPFVQPRIEYSCCAQRTLRRESR